MPLRRRTQVLLACLALTAVSLLGLAATRRAGEPRTDPKAVGDPVKASREDPRDEAATMPDPRGRTVYPDASCVAPVRTTEAGPTPRCVVSFGRAMTAVGINPTGTLAITSLAHAATLGWTLPGATATLLFEPLPADAEARAILFDDSGREALFAVGSELWRYDTTSGRLDGRRAGPGGVIEDLAGSRGGSRVVVVAAGRAYLLDSEGEAARPLPTKSAALRVAIDDGGTHAAVAAEGGDVAIFDLRSSAPPEIATPSPQPASSIAFAGSRLLVAGSDGVLRILEARSGRETARVAVGTALLQLAVSRDGRRVATAGGDGAIRLHALPELRVTADLAWHRARVAALGFGAESTLVSADNDGDLAVWDLDASGAAANG